MTAPLPTPRTSPTAGLLNALTLRPAPGWVTNPDVIESIAVGFYEIDADIVTRDKPTLRQIEKRIARACCFYLVVQQTHVAYLEQRVTAAGPVAKEA
ncbi:hypothetical protein ABZX95_17535 [Streptomyces sp. NPDC004232]|uniref:hypothetical protein n=1 Tax=Streptomyces sp. NPDC004232 TaxID=3154454 RepID=UPI0033AE13EF